jgi:hypothetical protein
MNALTLFLSALLSLFHPDAGPLGGSGLNSQKTTAPVAASSLTVHTNAGPLGGSGLNGPHE